MDLLPEPSPPQNMLYVKTVKPEAKASPPLASPEDDILPIMLPPHWVQGSLQYHLILPL